MSAHHDPIRLDSEALGALAARGVEVPRYDRSALVPRIVHIGVGGFHRAHLAVYLDDLARRGGDWGVCGVGLLDGDRTMADVLRRQDHLYALTTRHGDVAHTRVIGSIVDYVLAVDAPSLAAERISDERTAIVSLTVTEAGYAESPRNDRTFDTIADGLALRRDRGLGGLTVMSCDNMTGNGDVARRCVLDAAQRRDPPLADWVASHCTFPNSMVDRITPATTDGDRRGLVDTVGVVDEWPVVAESFRQWVLQDTFAAGRPDFAAAGVILADDVHPWELYKLRLLNAGHTGIAHLATLAGVDRVDEAMGDPDLGAFLRGLLLDESAPTLTPIAGHPPEQYVADVLDRFANTGIRDQIARLCVDTTAKIRTFMMPIVADRLAQGGSVDHLAHSVAAWAHSLASIPDEQQAADPSGDVVRPLARAAIDDPAVFLDERAGIPSSIAGDGGFQAAFVSAHRSIALHGARGAIRLVV